MIDLNLCDCLCEIGSNPNQNLTTSRANGTAFQWAVTIVLFRLALLSYDKVPHLMRTHSSQPTAQPKRGGRTLGPPSITTINCFTDSNQINLCSVLDIRIALIFGRSLRQQMTLIRHRHKSFECLDSVPSTSHLLSNGIHEDCECCHDTDAAPTHCYCH